VCGVRSKVTHGRDVQHSGSTLAWHESPPCTEQGVGVCVVARGRELGCVGIGETAAYSSCPSRTGATNRIQEKAVTRPSCHVGAKNRIVLHNTNPALRMPL